ncbi:MAG: hypothetical protein M0R50_10950, partial [Candidatus Cloacimonetes bacterium]|nr:hypothetical protein [Candidatus Cloacimonadota bacterium]
MADDINSYALNLAFQLRTGPAIASLGDVLDSITNIQKGILDVSKVLSEKVATTLGTIQKQFEAIVVSNDQISKTTTKFNTDFVKTGKSITLASKDYHKITLELEKQVKQYKLLNKEIKTQSVDNGVFLDQTEQQSKISEQVASTWASAGDSMSSLAKHSKQQSKAGEQVASAWASAGDSAASLVKKGAEHFKISENVAAAWTKVKGAAVDTAMNFASMLIGIQAVKSGFTSFLDEENKFNTLNYRMYGTQNNILKQVV